MNIKPARKVSVGALTGAAVIIALWGLRYVYKIEVPGEVASAITTITSFGMSWIIPEAMQDG